MAYACDGSGYDFMAYGCTWNGWGELFNNDGIMEMIKTMVTEITGNEIYRMIVPPCYRKEGVDHDVLVYINQEDSGIQVCNARIAEGSLAVFLATDIEKMYYNDVFENSSFLKDGYHHVPVDSFIFKLWIEDRDFWLKTYKNA